MKQNAKILVGLLPWVYLVGSAYSQQLSPLSQRDVKTRMINERRQLITIDLEMPPARSTFRTHVGAGADEIVFKRTADKSKWKNGAVFEGEMSANEPSMSGALKNSSQVDERRWSPLRALIKPTRETKLSIEQKQTEENVIDSRALAEFPDRERVWTHSLLIKDVAVVDDSRATGMGKWSFGYLMGRLAELEGVDSEWFVRRWLKHWEVDQSVNFENVSARSGIANLLDQWSKTPEGKLDLSQAPFRLLAIVHRIDLRGDVLLGGPGSAGENRFVFCAIDAAGNPQQFTVIFEYGIRAQTHSEVVNEARKWLNLTTWDVGTPIYNEELERLTEDFVVVKDNPQGNRLDQLRTNEIALDSPWEIREFRISPRGDFDAGHLRQVTVKQTPQADKNNSASLVQWINENASTILNGAHVMPNDLDSEPLAGGAIFVQDPAWNLNPGVATASLRHAFGVQTCNGCHFSETGTAFTHIKPRAAGTPSSLSGFMTGIDVPDLKDSALTRHFDEKTRRLDDFERLIQLEWKADLFRTPTTFEH